MEWINKSDTTEKKDSLLRKISKVICACFLVKCRKDKPPLKKAKTKDKENIR